VQPKSCSPPLRSLKPFPSSVDTFRMIRRRVFNVLVALACGLAPLVAVPAAHAAAGDIVTVAGSNGEGQATAVGQRPSALAFAGPLLYIADAEHAVVRAVDTRTGAERVVAGNGYAPGPGPNPLYPNGNGGPAVNAQLTTIVDLATDANGNLYIVDMGSSTVRRVDPAGTITTVAGVPTPCCSPSTFSGDGGPATQAQLSAPQGIAVDGRGNLFVADSLHNRIRRVDPSGRITTFAGDGSDTGPVANPLSLAFDGAGNLYFSTGGTAVKRISPAGVISPVAGTGQQGSTGDGGPATAAQVNVKDLAVDAAGNVFIASDTSYVRRISAATGAISTLVGTGARPRAVAVAVDPTGVLHVADDDVFQVRKVGPAGEALVAGNGTKQFGGDGGPATKAQFANPFAVALDGAGNQYVADRDNNRIRTFTLAGTVSTLAQLERPTGVALDGAGRLYVAAHFQQIYRVDTATGATTLFAGGGTRQGEAADGHPATEADLSIDNPDFSVGMLVDRGGNLVFTESGRNRIRKIDQAGTISTILAGDDQWQCASTTPSPVLACPSGLAADAAGNLYVGEYPTRRLQRINTTGTVTDLTPVLPAGFKPGNLAVDGAGNLLVGDNVAALVVLVPPSGPTRAVVGGPGQGFFGDGGPADQAKLYRPTGLFVGGADLFIADTGNGRIRKVTGVAQPSTTRTVRAWGWNGVGQLGNGTTGDQSTPTQVPGLGPVAAVAAGYYHSLAVKGGEVWAWGWNPFGQLGNGTTVDSAVPVKVPGLTSIVRVVAGAYHSLAVDSSGAVYAWGWNGLGLLGNGTTVSSAVPVRVALPGPADYVAAGQLHSVAQLRNGTVWSWGWNAVGQLGDGTTVDRYRPVQAVGLAGISYVAAGAHHTLAMTGTGQLYAWGWNPFGQLGDGTTTDRHAPVRVPLSVPVRQVAAGMYHTLALVNQAPGGVLAWGWNGVGQLGDGTTTDRWAPVAVSGLEGVTEVGAGAYHSLAVRNDGTVRAWGWNPLGQLGDGTAVDRHVPVEAPAFRGAIEVSGGAVHSLGY
jgi:alpha-tubulin suppressor-like RCC1 family protein/sugar lactone lactonase YvrE